MTTPISIVSLDQGKNIYKDWTLETVDETPRPTKLHFNKRVVALCSCAGVVLAVVISFLAGAGLTNT
jgi:hypothetical protein